MVGQASGSQSFNAWELSREELFSRLDSSKEGLHDADVRERRKEFGPNEIV